MNDTKAMKIFICLGSSCFSRGNGDYVEKLQNYIRENDLEDYVELSGKLCDGKCHDGPIIQLDNHVCNCLDDDKFESILSSIKSFAKEQQK